MKRVCEKISFTGVYWLYMKLLGPIIKKELEVKSRGYSFPAVIAVINIILFIISLVCTFAVIYRMKTTYEIMYRSFLDIYVLIAMAACSILLLAAPLYTAAAVSGERATGTFDLLLSTNLSPLDIVLEKLASAALEMCINTVTCLPAVIIPLMFGGVSFIDAILLLISFFPGIFLMLSAGLLASSLTASVTRSIAAAYGICLGLTAGLLIVELLADAASAGEGGLLAFAAAFNPLYTVLAVLDLQTGGSRISEGIFAHAALAEGLGGVFYSVLVSAAAETALGAGFVIASVISIAPGRYIIERKKRAS